MNGSSADNSREPKPQLAHSVRQTNWGNISVLFAAHFFAVVGAPLYFIYADILVSDFLLLAFYILATGLSITVGYHRLFSHSTFRAHTAIRFLVLFFGAAAFQHSVLTWASAHRNHHRYVDTDRDPYSIKKGFFHAHMGWMMFWKQSVNFDNARDLQKSRLIMHQHHFYPLWSLTASVALPMAIGALTGHVIEAFILSVAVRLTVVYHSTWCINSVCHMFGKATYDIYSSAKDHWFAAILTSGEGYHNYHHRFPADYRNGVCWYHWDPTKWIIALLARFGLTWGLKRVSQFRILAAKLASENQRIEDRLLEKMEHPYASSFRDKVQFQYTRLKQTLSDWECATREKRNIFHNYIQRQAEGSSTLAGPRIGKGGPPAEVKRQVNLRILEAKLQFQEVLAQWKSMIERQPQFMQGQLT